MKAFALAAVFSVNSLPAGACSPVVDNRSYGERLAAEQLAFVGVVTAVQGRKVSFEVAHTIKGADQKIRVIEAATPSTCAISFAAGQKWLYAGNMTFSPSVLLRAETSKATGTEPERFQRSDDKRLGLPAGWQACTSNEQCVPVTGGCISTAANVANAESARRRAIEVAGDPRALECARKQDVATIVAPQCVQARCGAWVIDYNVRP